MKKLYFLLLALATTLATKAQQTEVEPNETFAQAQTLELGKEMKGTISVGGDNDYYKVTVTQAGTLVLSFENTPAVIRPQFTVYDASRTQLKSNWNDSGKNLYLNVNVCSIGTYYILVNDFYGFSSSKSSENYIVKAVLNTDDAYECNNSLSTAKPIQSGQAIKIAIGSQYDNDYFKITAKRAGVLRVSVENTPSNIRASLNMYDSKTQNIGNTSGNQGKNIYKDVLVCNSGDYYIQITDFYEFKDGYNTTLFDLKVTLDTTDVYECNNTFTDAKTIQIGTAIKAAIGVSDDIDYYKFTIDKRTILDFTIKDVPAAVTPYLVIYGSNQQEITRGYANKGTTLELNKVILNDAGTYYVKIEDGSFYGGSPSLYTFTASLYVPKPPKLSTYSETTVCPNTKVTISAAGCPGTVKWNTGATGKDLSVTPTATTNYTTVCEDEGLTSVASLPFTITTKPGPSATASATNNGIYYESQTIELSSSGGGTYSWEGPDYYSSTLQNPKITNSKARMSGTYRVTVEGTNGCTATAETKVTVALLTSNQPLVEAEGVVLFPNPAENHITIQNADNMPYQFIIYDQSGRTMSVMQDIKAASQKTIEVGSLQSGNYFIRFTNPKKQVAVQFLRK
jgi:hypothetical protein